MKLSDEKIIEAYNKVLDAGHPDPSGFIVRGDIKTGHDVDGEYKGAVGAFGVDKKKALDAGFTIDELGSTDGNIDAALDVDMQSLRMVNGDSYEMFVESNPKSSNKSTARFMKKLDRRKAAFEDKLIFNNDGYLEGINREKKDNSLDYDNGDDIQSEVKSQKSTKTDSKRQKSTKNIENVKESIFLSKAVDINGINDIIKKTRTYSYQKKDKAKIDDLLKKLVKAIIEEKPIGRI